MKARSRSIVILFIVFAYILLQFTWWEVLLVRQTGQLINEKQKLAELSIPDEARLKSEIGELHHTKKLRTIMIAGEGTVFLLLLIFGVYKIKQSMDRESELGRQQKNFFLSVTHELKTPIAATKLQLQTMQRPQLEACMRSQLLNNALQETERLNQLIDNILFASRLESGQFVMQLRKANLSELVLQVLQRYYSSQIASGLLVHQVESQLSADIDAETFPSIVTNLVDNALKYAAGSVIKVGMQKNGNEIILTVADQGPGIAEAEKQKVFERFFRSGDEETRRTKGTGLGLYIVSYIVGNHGGRVKVRDNKPMGAIFEVTLHAA